MLLGNRDMCMNSLPVAIVDSAVGSNWTWQLLISVSITLTIVCHTPFERPNGHVWLSADKHQSHQSRIYEAAGSLELGTCESFFSVWIESRIESAVYTRQAVTAWRTAGVLYRPIICWWLALWTNESDVRNWVLVHFNSVLKRVKQCRCTLI